MRKKVSPSGAGLLFVGILLVSALGNLCDKDAERPTPSTPPTPSAPSTQALPKAKVPSFSPSEIFTSVEAVQIDTYAASDPRAAVEFYQNLPPKHAIYTVVLLVISAPKVAEAVGVPGSELSHEHTLFGYTPGGTRPAQLTFFEGSTELPQGSWNGYTIEQYEPLSWGSIRMVVSVRGAPNRVRLDGEGWPGVEIAIPYRPLTKKPNKRGKRGK